MALRGTDGDNASLVAAGDAEPGAGDGTELIVFEAGGAAFKVVRRYTVADTPTWAHLAVVADGSSSRTERSRASLRF